jgi:hypothetical protein
MIAYEFVPLTSRSLDELQAELIVLPFFSDERPLRGAAGLLDWRLCGGLSRKLMAGYLDGTRGEKAWVTAPRQLKSGGLLLFGLGASAEFDDGAGREACAQIAAALRDAKASTVALVLPGRSLGLLPPVDAMQLWLDEAPLNGELEEISIIESPDEHRALDSLLDGLRRQAESPLG